MAQKGDWNGVQQPVEETRQEYDETTLIRDRKQYIRRSIRAVRQGLSEAERLAHSHRIWERVAGLSCYQHTRVLLGYMAFDHEVLTDGLIRQAIASGKQIVLPMVQADRQRLALYAIEDLARDVVPGYCGILEPRPLCTQAVAPEALDLALVPGVAFDMRGGRLGFGAGFYDRFLGGLPRHLPTVGMAFDFQVIPRLPFQPHDVVLDAIVTDSRVIWGTTLAAGSEAVAARFSNVAGEGGRCEQPWTESIF
jgi:5-formyltetrahydrofolate cyclo-ligase